MHIERQVKKSGNYYYLVENIRLSDNKWKKVRIYLGSNLGRKKIQKLKKNKSKELLEKIRKEKENIDPLLTLISRKQLEKLDYIKKAHRERKKKLDRLQYQNYYESFITEFTYDTNAIEGSTVTLQETGMILFEHIVPEGRSITEINEVQNHKDAFDFMLNYKGDLNKIFILKLHKKLMHNILWKYSGIFRDVQVYVRGSDFTPTKPEHIEKEFKKLMLWYRSNKRKYHTVIIAAYVHHLFESIHPFRDGNGRTGRLILNFILRKNGFPMINIKYKNRSKYYEALQRANRGDIKPLVDLIIYYLIEENRSL
jgi:Fic family protein